MERGMSCLGVVLIVLFALLLFALSKSMMGLALVVAFLIGMIVAAIVGVSIASEG